jgi:hypothetical protein
MAAVKGAIESKRYNVAVPRRSSPLLGILTSALLAALTLTVFAKNQFAGPESTTLRLLRAIRARDGVTVQRLVLGNPNEIAFVAGQLSAFVSQSQAYAVIDVRMAEDRAFVTAVFVNERGEARVGIPMVRTESGWMMDARNPGWRSQ